ncbi:MAG: 3D domain-containing protein [Candidatus Improbicoccus pseudotrichonymphae]|uniref:3D domain-containing protein n=1 Tax=Candidatus Improbicoccus pseudotrichonymphae TaxID=3033792 RepID=A0AA48KZE6_9FIRM|nr:MAG: 3D domain-containing protein [Candidatus Improbicoccus pseudotrichonymphae]
MTKLLKKSNKELFGFLLAAFLFTFMQQIVSLRLNSSKLQENNFETSFETEKSCETEKKSEEEYENKNCPSGENDESKRNEKTKDKNKILNKNIKKPKEKREKLEINTENEHVFFNGEEYKILKAVKGKVTAYTAIEGKKTATGTQARVGVVAVNSEQISYGSQVLIICNNGKFFKCVAEDTGGAMKSGKRQADIYMPTKRECVNFGVQPATIYCLEKIDIP